MNDDDPYVADISRLNYEAMVLFREMVRRDKADACLRLDLDVAAAEALANVTLEDLRKIADTGILLFSARFGRTQFWEDSASATRGGDENAVSVAGLHAALFATQGES